MKVDICIFYSLICITVISFLNIRCSSVEYIPEKLDTALRQKISKMDGSSSNNVIQIIGKTSTEINEEMKSKLEQAGISIESIIGNIFTASANPKSIKKATLLNFVVFIELTKTMDIK